MALGVASFPVKNHRFDALKNPVFLRFQADNLDVDTIVFQSGNIIRYTFNGTPDLSEIVLERFLTVNSATNASNNGVFEIVDVNDASDFIEVINTARSDATDDEATDSPATAGTIEPLTVPASANQGSLFVEKVLEVPAFLNEDGSNSAPSISGLTLVNTSGDPSAPSAGQFAVNYDTGEFIFNSAQAGTSFEVDYFGKGSMVEEEEINLIARVSTFYEVIFNDNANPFVSVSGGNTKVVGLFLFRGSDVLGTPESIKVIMNATSDATVFRVAVRDVTNSTLIAELTGITNITASTIIDLGALTNIPTDESVFSIEIQKTSGGGAPQISFLTIEIE